MQGIFIKAVLPHDDVPRHDFPFNQLHVSVAHLPALCNNITDHMSHLGILGAGRAAFRIHQKGKDEKSEQPAANSPYHGNRQAAEFLTVMEHMDGQGRDSKKNGTAPS